jgi:hypothetical protein
MDTVSPQCTCVHFEQRINEIGIDFFMAGSFCILMWKEVVDPLSSPSDRAGPCQTL